MTSNTIYGSYNGLSCVRCPPARRGFSPLGGLGSGEDGRLPGYWERDWTRPDSCLSEGGTRSADSLDRRDGHRQAVMQPPPHPAHGTFKSFLTREDTFKWNLHQLYGLTRNVRNIRNDDVQPVLPGESVCTETPASSELTTWMESVCVHHRADSSVC